MNGDFRSPAHHPFLQIGYRRRHHINAQLITALLLSPFALAFVYAGIHEYLRYKSEGRANYGLVFDEETGTTYVTGIGEDEDAFDPEDFNPDDFNDPDDKQESPGSRA